MTTNGELKVDIWLVTYLPIPEEPATPQAISEASQSVVGEVLAQWQTEMGSPFNVKSIDVDIDFTKIPNPIRITVKGAFPLTILEAEHGA